MLNFKKIVLRRGTKVVLSQATATIQVGEKVGLIGRNGAGKSSLFALITRQLQEDQGEWSMPENWEISQVEQHIPETDQGATDFVLEGDLRLGRVLAELHQAELRDDGEAMAFAHAALDDAGGHTARSRAQAMLLGLGFNSDELDNPVNSFSGGWRMPLWTMRAATRHVHARRPCCWVWVSKAMNSTTRSTVSPGGGACACSSAVP